VSAIERSLDHVLAQKLGATKNENLHRTTFETGRPPVPQDRQMRCMC
jgi:hypothetical protein